MNFIGTEATGPDGAFGFLPVASKVLSSPNLKFGVLISGSALVGYGVVGARPDEDALMKGIGEVAKETPDLGVATKVADVGVTCLSNAAPTGDGACTGCVGLVANNEGLAAATPIGVAVRAPAKRSKVCNIRFAVSVVTALVTGLAEGVWYAGLADSRASAPGPGLCAADSNRRGVVTRARSRSRSMIVSSRSRFKLARGGVGVCSIGGSRIVGFIAVRPRVPRSDGVPDAPYDRRTDAYPGELAPTPVVPGVAICATIGRSRAGVACASNAGARSNGDGGFTAALISPYAPPALDRAIRSLSICPRRKNSLISVNGVGESLAVSAVAASFANRVVLVAPPTSPIRPVVVVVPALAPPAPFPRVLTLCSSSIARPTSIVRFSFAPPSKPSPSSSPCQKNPPTSADAIFVALRTGVATLHHIFFAFDDGASRVSSLARPSFDDGVMTSVLVDL